MRTPERTAADQRREALHKANLVRTQRAQLRFELAHAQSRAAAVDAAIGLLHTAAWWLEGMTVATLLQSCRGVGPVAARKALRSAGVAPSRPLGRLTARERAALAGSLRTLGLVERDRSLAA